MVSKSSVVIHPTRDIIRSPEWKSKDASSSEKSLKRSIRFDERVRVRKTMPLTQFSEKEVQDCWYCDADFNEMRNQVRTAAHLIEQGLLDADTELICRRGAEDHAPTQAKSRRKTRDAARFVVLREQFQQQSEGTSDPEYIALLSRRRSAKSTKLARQVGLQDELDVLF